MLLEGIFVVRGGFWGEEYDFKLLFAAVAIFICVLDYKWKKRKDYLWVFLVGFIFWSSIEFALQVTGIREMPNRYLFGMQIPFWLAILIQGTAEGVSVGVVGLFITDLYLDEKTRMYSYLVFGIIVVLLFLIMFSHGIYTPNVGGEVPSRREVFPIWEVLIFILSAPAIYWFIKAKKPVKKRAFFMFLVMFLLGSIWYLFYWLSGQRWVEIGTQNPDGSYSNLRRAEPFLEFLVMLYNAVVEIALIYMMFLAIPYLLHLIEPENLEKRN